MCTIQADTTIRCQHYQRHVDAMVTHAGTKRRRVDVAGLLGWLMLLCGAAVLIYLAYACC